jgi:predicted transcriptional regulator
MSALTAPMSIKLASDLRDRLNQLAMNRKRTSHALAREAIERFIESEEAHDQLRQEALASWQEYQETGLHLTGDEVGQWLATWGTTEEKPAPPSHT